MLVSAGERPLVVFDAFEAGDGILFSGRSTKLLKYDAKSLEQVVQRLRERNKCNQNIKSLLFEDLKVHKELYF